MVMKKPSKLGAGYPQAASRGESHPNQSRLVSAKATAFDQDREWDDSDLGDDNGEPGANGDRLAAGLEMALNDQDRRISANLPSHTRPPHPPQTETVFDDRALRPTKLAEFVGQSELRENLAVFIAAAKARNEAMDHLLISGPPGLGKTTLAQIVAHELGVNFRATSGPVIVRAGDLAALLTNLEPRDVLFIDEIHRLNPAVEEILYPAMEDRKLDLMIGEGPAARSVQIGLNPFTLVAATTRTGLVSRPLRERFGIPLRLQFYRVEELLLIVERAARLLGMKLNQTGALEIAKRSRGTPRIAGRLLRRVRDFAEVAGISEINQVQADAALLKMEVDARGLDQIDRKYLRALATINGGAAVGLETLAAFLGEERDVLEDVIEPYLLQEGLLMRTPRGRCLARAGWDFLGMAVPQTIESALPLAPTETESESVSESGTES